ncbi:MAG TPA: Cys-tRNA(Pro) deacylase [Acidimicrobiia bacterium]|jgi:Cys-tRNA(Pro)/Cys-tRNA(Cys) deacylase
MSTAAIRFLEEAGVEFETYDYEVDEAVGEGYGEAVALAIGAEPERVFKTLLAEIDGSHVVVAIIPVSQRLSTKALARVAGGKKASLADRSDAARLTGYLPGGISPFGQRRSLPTFVDETVERFATVFVSGGKRGLQVELAPSDLIRLTRAKVAPLT